MEKGNAIHKGKKLKGGKHQKNKQKRTKEPKIKNEYKGTFEE